MSDEDEDEFQGIDSRVKIPIILRFLPEIVCQLLMYSKVK